MESVRGEWVRGEGGVCDQPLPLPFCKQHYPGLAVF